MNIRIFQGLRGRMLLSVGAAAFGGLGIVTAMVAFQTSRAARLEAIARAEQQAALVGERVRQRLNESMGVARSAALTFEGIKATKPDRAMADAVLRQTLEKNPGMLALWTVWEPNAFDGRDAEFAGRTGHDATGRYVPYWNRGTGKVTLEPSKNYTTDGEGDYYLLPKRMKAETVLEPYVYKVGERDVLRRCRSSMRRVRWRAWRGWTWR